MNKHQKYRAKLRAEGKCPHCGKPCAPYSECEERREYKALAWHKRQGKFCKMCGVACAGQVCRACFSLRSKQRARAKKEERVRVPCSICQEPAVKVPGTCLRCRICMWHARKAGIPEQFVEIAALTAALRRQSK